jgi:hypothetical protein
VRAGKERSVAMREVAMLGTRIRIESVWSGQKNHRQGFRANRLVVYRLICYHVNTKHIKWTYQAPPRIHHPNEPSRPDAAAV